MKKDKTMVQEIKEFVGKELKGFKQDFGKELKDFRQGFSREIKEYVGREIGGVKRHTGVLVEGLHSEVRIVSEQHGDIIRKLEKHDIRFDRIDLELKGIKVALFDNSHRLNDHDTRIRKLETS